MADYIPLVPEYDRIAELVTFQDAVEKVLTHFDRPAEERDRFLARRAVSDAVRELSRYPWKWHTGVALLQTEAFYETGTIAYTHATKTVTLTSGTWPANAAWGHIKIDRTVYLVASRVSDSEITLRTDANPGANVAAGESYSWFRQAYPLPPGFIESLSDPHDTAYATGAPNLQRVTNQTLLAIRRLHSATAFAYPSYYAIERDPRRAVKVFVISPPPSTARTYEYVYRRRPRMPQTEKYFTGRATVTSGSTAVVGTGTAWASKHVGCVLRVSENDSAEPTSVYGNRRTDGGMEVHQNPAALTRIITAVADATHCTIDAAADVSLSAKRYTISDWLDVDWDVCGEYFDRLTEWYFAAGAHETAVGESRIDPIEQRQAMAMNAFHRAADHDRMRDSVNTSVARWTSWDAYLGPDNVSTEYA